MLLDGYEVPPIHHAVVLVEGDRIVKMGRASDIPIPSGYEVIDTRGRTMLPGFIDLHAHLTILGHGDYSRYCKWLEEESDLSLEDIMEISAKQLLDAGITTAVDLGAPLEESVRVRDRIARGEIPGPRILVSGAWVARRTFGGFPSEAQRLVSSPDEAVDRCWRRHRHGHGLGNADELPYGSTLEGDQGLRRSRNVPSGRHFGRDARQRTQRRASASATSNATASACATRSSGQQGFVPRLGSLRPAAR